MQKDLIYTKFWDACTHDDVISLLEVIDHVQEIDKKNGYIMRSRYEDKRNTDKEIRFNSIILDATIIN